MAPIEQLLGKEGDAISILGASAMARPVDLSDDTWDQRLVVLRRLKFNRIRLARKKILVNFVECEFADSDFVAVTSEGHFWSASDAWLRCSFESVHLSEVISPMNTFSECRFIGASLTNYRPYQTLFQGCLFEQSGIAGLKAQQISNSINRNAALAGRQSTLVFQGCEFRNVSFNGCFFAGVQFDDCRFSNVDAQACDFTGIESSQPWWPEQKSNPFTTFLTQTLEMIRQRCGAESTAHSQFEDYVLDYATGKTTSQDFSACLYSGKIPDAELDKIEDELSNLMRKFPF
jgi:uncharacterized protein YjbI with pentapeptide repeats